MSPRSDSLRMIHGAVIGAALFLVLTGAAFAGDVWQQTRMKPFEDECVCAPCCVSSVTASATRSQVDREDSTTAGAAQVMPPTQPVSGASAPVVPPVQSGETRAPVKPASCVKNSID